LGAGQLQVVSSYTYLGLQVCRTATQGKWNGAVAVLLRRATFNSAELLHWTGGKHGLCPALQAKLWQSHVRPVLEYGAEVWSPQISNTCANKLEAVQHAAARRILGCGSGASNVFVLRELGMCTLQARRDEACMRLWAKLCNSSSGSLLSHVFRWRLRLATSGGGLACRSWCTSIRPLMTSLGLEQQWFAGTAVPPNTHQHIDNNSANSWVSDISSQQSGKAVCPWAAHCKKRVRQLATALQQTQLEAMPLLVLYRSLAPDAGRAAGYLDSRYNMNGRWIKTRLRSGTLPTLAVFARRMQWPSQLDTCVLCSSGEPETSAHMLLRCTAFDEQRSTLCEVLRQRMSGAQGTAIVSVLCNDVWSDNTRMQLLLGGNPFSGSDAAGMPAAPAGWHFDTIAEETVDRATRNFLFVTWRRRTLLLGATLSIAPQQTNQRLRFTTI
jgi:hypothetical protein